MADVDTTECTWTATGLSPMQSIKTDDCFKRKKAHYSFRNSTSVINPYLYCTNSSADVTVETREKKQVSVERDMIDHGSATWLV